MIDASAASSPSVHVVAAVIRDDGDRVLLAQRPPGKHLAGLWEFPGGKVEPGERAEAALIRELEEELNIHAHIGAPVISIPHGRIRLDVFNIASHTGRLHAREGQALRWTTLADIDIDLLPEADRPVVAALRLPDRYLIAPAPRASEIPEFLRSIKRALVSGSRLLQLRLPGWTRDEVASLARAVRDLCRQHGASLLLNSDWQLAEVLGLDGVHLPSRIAMNLSRRPVGPHRWLAVSCHNADELQHAASIGADFATLSPVNFTPSHTDSISLGWPHFTDLVANAPLPVYALGGMQVSDIETARASGAQGIAAIRALWPNHSLDFVASGPLA
ncbi:MAG: Nudix family hydrolase [Dokdonella sp.]